MTWSVALEIVERLAAALAAPQPLAGSRTKFRQQLGIAGAALRTGHHLRAKQRATAVSLLRRRDAVILQLAATVVAQPVRGPGRRQHGADLCMRNTFALKRQLDFK